MTRRGILDAGLLLGLSAGLWDGGAILLENPGSFGGLATSAAFLGAAVVLSVLAAGIAAAGLALVPGIARRLGPGRIVGGGLALWVFLWAGVRVHVRFLFGEPLLSPESLGANVLVAAVAAGAGAAFWRVAGRPVRTLVGARGFARGVAAGVGACGILAGVLAPRIEPASARGVAPVDARDLLLITLDTTRADHVSCYGYPRGTTPAIDRLARRGVIWTSVYAPIPLTNPSHSSLFTGLLPRQHGVRNNGTPLPDSVPTFVRDLADHGWSCAAFVSGIPLKASLSGLWPGFSVYDDAFSPLERIHPMLTSLALVRVANRLLPGDVLERRARRTCKAAVRWLQDSEGPRFLWVHLFDPHTPYDARPILRRRFSRECAGWSAHGRDVTGWPIAAYDAELREADRGVDRLVRRFLEVCPEGVVVVTADHGEGLLQHGELTHGSQLYTEDLRVPLVVTGGEPGPGIVSGVEWSITWLRRALPGWVRLPGSAPGGRPGGLLCETFAPEGKENRTAVLFRGRDGALAKLIVNWDTGEELAFDLTADPGETRPLDPQDRRWDLHRRALPGNPASASPDLDPETVRRLRALGYIH